MPSDPRLLWPYQEIHPWTVNGGTLSDQARLWLNALRLRVNTTGGGGAFTAGGDLSGTSTSQTVIGIEGRPVSATAPTDTQVLTWVATDGQWEPKPVPSAALPIVVREVPAGTMNGTNLAFTLSFTPNPAASFMLYLNGIEQDPSRWYTISGNTITYTVAPKVTDQHLAEYTH